MSEAQLQTFNDRLRKIVRRHERLARGATMMVTETGLIVARPKAWRLSFPWRGAMVLVATTLFLKGALYAEVGVEGYTSRVELLSLGSPLEKAAAWVLHADPATVWIAEVLTGIATTEQGAG